MATPTNDLGGVQRLLFVCLGNICRSPAAEAIMTTLAQGLEQPLHIESAGTSAYHIGELPDPRMRRALDKRGYQTCSRAQSVAEHHIDEFDLILAMDQQNYKNLHQIFADHPASQQKIVLMCDFCSPAFAAHREVPDPYFGGSDGFELVIDLLEDSCRNLLDAIIT